MRNRVKISVVKDTCTFEDLDTNESVDFHIDELIADERATKVIKACGYDSSGLKYIVVTKDTEAISNWLDTMIFDELMIAVYGRDICLINKSREYKHTIMFAVLKK